MKYRRNVLGLAVLLAACGTTPDLTPIPSSEQTIAPASEEPSQTAGLLPLLDIPHALAMRPGFEGDVETFGNAAAYVLNLTLDLDPLRVSGREEIIFTNRTPDPLEEIVLRLYANAIIPDADPLIVSDLRVDEVTATFEINSESTVLRVPLNEPLEPDRSVRLTMTFELQLPPGEIFSYGRLIDQDGSYALTGFFPLLSVYQDGDWWTVIPRGPGDPGFSQVALYEVTLDAPSELAVASSGVTISEETIGERAIYHFGSGPVRDFALALSADFILTTTHYEDVTINVWSLSEDSNTNQAIHSMTAHALRTFDDLYGPYPFNEIDVVESPMTAAGIEYPGLIFISSNLWDSQNDILEHVIVHEVGHQWWYSMVGSNQVDEPWLDEGLTEYVSARYFGEQYSLNYQEGVLNFYRGQVADYLEEGGEVLPLALPAERFTGGSYRALVYSSGAVLFAEMGPQEEVDAMLAAYYEAFRYRIATSADLQKIIEETLGPEAARVYSQQVFGDG